MNYKIFQICFQKDQIDKVDSRLTPFDNTKNEKPELREYHNFKRIIDEGFADDLDAWGVFGPRWQEKLRYSSEDIVREIETHPNKDIYIFNHARIQTALTYNVWEQGEMYHKGIGKVIRHVMTKLYGNQSAIDEIMGENNVCYCSYFVAKKQFWLDYIQFVDSILEELDNLPEDLAEIYYGSANYSRDKNLNMFPFIVERLFSTFLVMTNCWDIHVKPYDYSVYKNQINDLTAVIKSINNLKNSTIKSGSDADFENWNNIRLFFVKTHPQLFNLD